MARIVFVIDSHPGHVHSTLRLARKLHRRGHAIHYLGSETTARLVRDQGFDATSDVFMPSLPSPGNQTISLGPRELAAEVIESAASAVQRIRPDLLVFDPFLLSYYIPFWPHRIPAVALSTKPLLDWDPKVPPYTSGIIPSRGKGLDLRVNAAWCSCWTKYLRYKLWCASQKIRRRPSAPEIITRIADMVGYPLRNEWIRRPITFDFCLRTVPELVLWSEAFDFPRERPLREAVSYIGASVDLERKEIGFDWSIVPSRPRLVYCALGTVESPGQLGSRIEFLRKVMAAFRSIPDCALLMACGKAAYDGLKGDLPSNVCLVSEAPQLAVLRRADLMINHGGGNSVKECLMLGKPLLIYPRRADQPGNSARVVFHGVGLRGDPERDAPAGIAGRVRRILGDSRFQENVARIRADFERYDRLDLDVQAIERRIG